MNEKEAAIIKALAELGLYKEQPLTAKQEQLFKRAIDPEEEFLAQVEQLFHVKEADEFAINDDPISQEQWARKKQFLHHHITMLDKEIWDLVKKHNLAYDATGRQNQTSVKRKRTSIISPQDARHYITIKNLDPTSELGRRLLDLDRRRSRSLNIAIELG